MRTIAATFLLWSCITGCGRGVIEPPDSPDLLALRTSFNAPTGRLTEETARALVDGVTDLEAELRLVDSLGVFFTEVVDTLETADEETESEESALGIKRSPLTISGAAWARLKYICGPAGIVDEAQYGRAILNMILDDPELLSVYWGELTECVIDSDDGPLTLSSDVILDVSNVGELMVALDGTVRSADGLAPSTLRFSIGADRFSFITTALNESFVISFENGGTITVRDCAGDWSCDFDSTSCRFASATGTCDPIVQEINWP